MSNSKWYFKEELYRKQIHHNDLMPIEDLESIIKEAKEKGCTYIELEINETSDHESSYIESCELVGGLPNE